MSGIKSDRWIRRQCIPDQGQILQGGFKPMIEPFEPQQVRTQKLDSKFDTDLLPNAGKIISYGTSSYGYDVRCAPEFKIFTNIHSTVVDPKKFDDKSFVDMTGDSCIIPPNSFALARTVEYFRIPRDILVICLGKSTYARCFSGATRVALANGTSVSFKDMVKRSERGERFFGYGMSKKHGIVVTELMAPRLIANDESLIRVELDKGRVDCTPDHKFLTRDGRYVKASNLTVGDSLMPLYRYEVRGREVVYNPDLTDPNSGELVATYRLSDAFNVRNGVYKEQRQTHRHHKDHNKKNDYPTNIERVPAIDHVRIHNEEYYGIDFDPKLHSRRIRKALRALSLDPEWSAEYSAKQSKRAKEFWGKPKYDKQRKSLSAKHKANWRNPEFRAKQAASRAAFWNSEEGKQVIATRVMPKRKPLKRRDVESALRDAGSIVGAARLLGVSRPTVKRQFPNLVKRMQENGTLPTNHRVVSVTPIKGGHPVYCLTSPETGNFALESGVFVKNCGIIVNVTPLEPEWEGHITLEFSNTTPLPAKVYANEGCAQLLFLQADRDDICETSYKDRGGKYMEQRGITLPRP